MGCSKCGTGMGFCPVSFGLAMGLTGAIVVIAWSMWMMFHGMPDGMMGMPEITWGGTFMRAFWSLVKGFVIGFLFALIYDGVLCCTKRFRCGKNGKCSACGCDVKSK